MLATLLVLALVRPADGAAGPGRVDPRIFAGKAEGERSSYLVVLREQADLSGAERIGDRQARRRFVFETLRAQADATQASLRRRLGQEGVPFRPHFLVNMIEVEGDEALARALAADEKVSAIERNAPARLKDPRGLPVARAVPRRAADVADIQPNLQKVRAPELWDQGFTGQGIVIGSADTGFQWDHPLLKGQYRGWNGSAVTHEYNWHDAIHDAGAGNLCGSDSPAPCDDQGHGTATSGIAVGDDGAGGRTGVAPGARLIGCRNMDAGTGTPARYAECFEWLLAPTDARGANPRPELGADVINNSWVCPASEGCTDPQILRSAVENVRAAGIMVVVAAGNDGFACGNIHDAPAIYDASFTIGATDNADGVAGFSSIGPVTIDGSFRLKPDLCAPGTEIWTASIQPTLFGPYEQVSGTSASAPHVTGAVALLWSAVPSLAGDVDETERVLEQNAAALTYPLFETGSVACGGYSGFDVPNPVFGWGRLDVGTAYFRLLHPREDHDAPARLQRRRPPVREVPARP